MALTRAMLKGMGLTDEQISAVIEEHTSVTGALKDQIKELQENADQLPEVQKELDKLKKDIADNDWKGKFDKEHEDFEKYKSDVTAKETLNKTKAAYKKLLAECKVGDKHVDSILKVTDFKDMKLKEDGTLDGVDALKEKINADWSGFITTEGTQGAGVETPPAGKGGNDSGSTGRAAQLAAKFHDNLYGKTKEE